MLVTFDELVPASRNLASPRDILALDSALDELERISERQARLVESRFFGGLEISELGRVA